MLLHDEPYLVTFIVGSFVPLPIDVRHFALINFFNGYYQVLLCVNYWSKTLLNRQTKYFRVGEVIRIQVPLLFSPAFDVFCLFLVFIQKAASDTKRNSLILRVHLNVSDS